MKKQEELLRQIRSDIEWNIDYLEFFYMACKKPEFLTLSAELKSACERISGNIDQPEPDFSNELSNLVELLKKCAEVTRDADETKEQNYQFLAVDFERLATDAADTLQAELVGKEGEANAPL